MELYSTLGLEIIIPIVRNPPIDNHSQSIKPTHTISLYDFILPFMCFEYLVLNVE